MKNTKGITLVALVVTIIILLILAGVTIMQLTENGLFENAKLAEEKYKNAQEKENSIIDDYISKIEAGLSDTSRENLCNHISDIIPEFEPIVKEINPKSIIVSVPEMDIGNLENISGYMYLLNGKVKGFTTDAEYEYTDLDILQTYKISVVAVDNNTKIKFSKEIETTTKDVTRLYDEGNECTELTGGWNVGYSAGTSAGVGSATKASNHIELKTWGTWCAYSATTVNTIDFTGVNKFYIDVYDIEKVNTGYQTFAIAIGSKSYTISVGTETSATYELDITAIQGQASVDITCNNGMSLKIRGIYVE